MEGGDLGERQGQYAQKATWEGERSKGTPSFIQIILNIVYDQNARDPAKKKASPLPWRVSR